MENIDKEIIDDAIQLCEKAINTKDDQFCTIGELVRRAITIEMPNSVSEYDDELGQVLHYKKLNSKYLLEKLGIIRILPKPNIKNLPLVLGQANNHITRTYGYFEVLFDYDKAREWVDRTIRNRLDGNLPIPQQTTVPDNSGFIYQNEQLRIKLQDQTERSLNFISSAITRPYFEAIFYLFKDSNKSVFTKKEICDEYKERQKAEMEWHNFVEATSDIRRKIKKAKLSKRITLKYDRKNDAYRFEILPLPSSDM